MRGRPCAILPGGPRSIHNQRAQRIGHRDRTQVLRIVLAQVDCQHFVSRLFCVLLFIYEAEEVAHVSLCGEMETATWELGKGYV